MPAAANTVKNLKFWPTICCERKVSSLTKITDAIEVPLIMEIVWLAMPGRMARIAWGRIMRRSVRNRPHAERGRGEALLAVYRNNAAADNLRAERGFIQHETDDGRGEAVELDSEQRQRVVEKDKLQDDRRATDEPDVEPRRSAHRRQPGKPHQGEHQAQHDAADHRERGDLQRGQRAVQQKAGGNVAQDFHQGRGQQIGPPAERKRNTRRRGQCHRPTRIYRLHLRMSGVVAPFAAGWFMIIHTI